jgi:translation elongation factor EF-1alpha
MKPVGKVTHYYGKIGVAIVELTGPLSVGDKVKFGDSDDSFEQTIDSMEVNHESVQKAKKGDVIGVKVAQKVDEKTLVLLAE